MRVSPLLPATRIINSPSNSLSKSLSPTLLPFTFPSFLFRPFLATFLSSTPPFSSSFYSYILRTLFSQFGDAFSSKRERERETQSNCIRLVIESKTSSRSVIYESLIDRDLRTRGERSEYEDYPRGMSL